MKLYNSLSRKTENFVPLDPSMVKIYSCGVTTYDEIHLGHVRQAVVFDVLRNYFEYLGYKVIYVRNFTDIDDKIIKKANDKHQDPLELSDYYVQETVKDLRKLKVGDATFQPKVTETIPEIIDFIGALIDKGNAYVANGEVLFDVDSFTQYGKLSGRKTEDLVSGDESANKRKPYDFSLWKPAKEGEPFWDSPWGPGRPGWHIECSVMAKKYLGDTFDIHGGGLDLVFPHHENEIAQSEAANGKVLANYWMHNGLVNLNGKKMSKSLGNFYTVKDLLKKYTVDEIRLAVLSRGFSLPLNFSEKLFVTTRKKLYNFYKILSKIDSILSGTIPDFSVNWAKYENIDRLESNFKTAMDDNFNTAKAITSIALAFDQASEVMEIKQEEEKKVVLSVFVKNLRKVASVLRILDEDPKKYIDSVKSEFLKSIKVSEDEIMALLAKRSKAKESKDYQTSDEIRKYLTEHKISVQDTKTGTLWDIDFS